MKRILELSPTEPPPADPTNRVADDAAAARLGQALFFDARLSKDGETSCATCHDPALLFTDGKALSEGVLPLDRHAPTLVNVAWQRWLFWDGRADTLWAQALVPLESPLEHAFTRLDAAKLVHADAGLRRGYETVFGPLPDLADDARFPSRARPVPADDHAHELARQHAAEAAAKDPREGGHTHGEGSDFYHPHQRAWDGMTPDDQRAATAVFVNLGKALAAYQRRLLAHDSPFDRFVRALREGDAGEAEAYPLAARRGLALFLDEGQCHFCHSGPMFSDFEFHDIGLRAHPDGRADDPGRAEGILALFQSEFQGAGPWSDAPEGQAKLKLDTLPKHPHEFREFKTPTLRNVARTAPYMHQGQFATLADVVAFYSTLEDQRRDPPPAERILKPLALEPEQEDDLVAFLESLTDDGLDPALLGPPATPYLDE